MLNKILQSEFFGNFVDRSLDGYSKGVASGFGYETAKFLHTCGKEAFYKARGYLKIIKKRKKK